MVRERETGHNPLDTCLVIGGSGMLGFEIAKQLNSDGKKVRILDLVPPEGGGFGFIAGDIRKKEDVLKACKKVDTVFQTAAEVWDPRKQKNVYDEVNIGGNHNVIEACKELGISRLIYTSTLDVVVDGKKAIVDGDESHPYPRRLPSDPYCRTKIIAEKMVLEANCPDLNTCSIRPVGIYGPRDKYHLTNIIKACLEGVDFKIGDGSAKFSHVYSENAAHAHILAAKNLKAGSPAAGNTYFITDYHPAKNLFEFMEPFLLGLGLKPPSRSIPYRIAYLFAWFYEIFKPGSNFNRFSVIQTCVDHTFISDKARRELGYRPIVSEEEAFKRTLEWFSKNLDDIKASLPKS